MFPKRFLPDRQRDPAWHQPGLSDIVFMSSRDGLRWDRRFLEAFLRPGLDPLNWHDRAIEVGAGLVPAGRCRSTTWSGTVPTPPLLWGQFPKKGRTFPVPAYQPKQPPGISGAVRIWQYGPTLQRGGFDLNLATREAFDRMLRVDSGPA